MLELILAIKPLISPINFIYSLDFTPSFAPLQSSPTISDNRFSISDYISSTSLGGANSSNFLTRTIYDIKLVSASL